MIRRLIVALLMGVCAHTAQLPAADIQLRPLQRALLLLSQKRPITPLFCERLAMLFDDTRIKECCEHVRHHQSMQPIIDLWNQIENKINSQNKQDIGQFIRFVIVVTYPYTHLPDKHDSTIDQILDLYEKISALPIPQLLNLLDTMVNQCEQITQQYELDNYALTWSDWLTKYWWAPPVIAFSLAVALYKHWYYNGVQG